MGRGRTLAAIAGPLLVWSGVVVTTAPPAAAAITPQVLITTVTTTGDGFAFAGAVSGTANPLASTAAPPATSTLVNGVVFFSSATAPTNPTGADSPYTFSNGTTTVVIPDSAVTTDTLGSRIVGQALLPASFVGTSATASFTGTVNEGTVNRWRFAAIYTTPGGTPKKQVAARRRPQGAPRTRNDLARRGVAVDGGRRDDRGGRGGHRRHRRDRLERGHTPCGQRTGTHQTPTPEAIPSGQFRHSFASAWKSGATTATGVFVTGNSACGQPLPTRSATWCPRPCRTRRRSASPPPGTAR